MKQVISLFLLIATSFAITACNTFKGMGQDIQKGGEKLEHVAEGK
jgi:entericidin B